jgi:ANTAR domain
MDAGEEAAERRLLDEAERDLAEREGLVGHVEWTTLERAAFAAERQALTSRRDDMADAHDVVAASRDQAAVSRDVLASDRDRHPPVGQAGDDPGFADRFLSAGNRDDSAGDRADSRNDRRRALADRQRAVAAEGTAAAATAKVVRDLGTLRGAIETRTLIGQATGVLMERYGLTPDRAFAMLARLSQEMNVKAHVVAQQVVSTTPVVPVQPVVNHLLE